MRVKALKQFSNSYTGSVLPGDYLTLPDSVAVQFQGFGLVELVREAPVTRPLDNGPARPSSASQAAQALPQTNATTSEDAPELSPSTPATSEHHSPTLSSPPIEHGGSDTVKKSRKRRKSGVATNGSNSTSGQTESE